MNSGLIIKKCKYFQTHCAEMTSKFTNSRPTPTFTNNYHFITAKLSRPIFFKYNLFMLFKFPKSNSINISNVALTKRKK